MIRPCRISSLATRQLHHASGHDPLLCSDAGYDPIEDRLRQNIRATIEALFEEELAAVIGRCRYDRGGGLKKGYRHGHRDRQLVGTFGTGNGQRAARADRERKRARSRNGDHGRCRLSASDEEGPRP